VTNFSCGGAAGAVSEVVQLRAADDPWGQFSHTVVVGTPRNGLQVEWSAARELHVVYASRPRQLSLDRWNGVEITYQPLPPCTLLPNGRVLTPCSLDQTR